MNVIRFWRDVWHGRPGARPIAWCIAVFVAFSVTCQLADWLD